MQFASKYYEDNPLTFENADAVYVLAFAIIMLQTDLHNVGVKRKMTVEQFIGINRGINNGKDFPADFLSHIYEDIKNNPFTLIEDELLRGKIENANRKQRMEFFTK